MIFAAATSPTPLIAPSPKRIESPSTPKAIELVLTSGGSTGMSISRQALIRKAMRSALESSPVSIAAMNSTG